jgi:multiple sugar transport system permease protein
VRARRQRPTVSFARREALTAYAFIAPQVVGMLVFVIAPLLLSLYYSFTKWDLIQPAPKWVGLANWEYLAKDPRIPKVLWNTVKFILVGTTSYLILALLVALVVNRAGRAFTAYRALFVLPFVLSTVAVGTSWRWVLDAQAGPVAQGLGALGIQSPQWLFDPTWAMIAIAMATTWQSLGFGMTVYLSRLKDIPRELYEAAAVDGARAWHRFRYVTFPQLSAVTFFLIVTSLIGALQLYDPVVAMTTDGFGNVSSAGGPQNSTRTILLYLYNQMFQYNERLSGMGYAAAIAWFLALLTLVITSIQFAVGRRWVFYERGHRS